MICGVARTTHQRVKDCRDQSNFAARLESALLICR
jgi:hypothetical protein